MRQVQSFFQSKSCNRKLHTCMRFRDFIIIEEGPMDMGGAPMGGAPPMGGDPMGGGMGGDPMGGGMDPMAGGAPPPMGGGEQEPPPVPQYADVWDVLDSLLNQKPLEQEEELAKQQQQQAEEPPADPMGMAPPGGDMMGGAPPAPAPGMADPIGGSAPHLMG